MFYVKFLFNAKYVVLLQKSSIKKLPKIFSQNLQENICLYRPVNVAKFLRTPFLQNPSVQLFL